MTPFGKMLRQERKERGMTLAKMANSLGVSSPYLSQMETGAKAIKQGIIEKVIARLELSAVDAAALRRAAAASTPKHIDTVGIRLPPNASARDRALATQFAQNFHRWKPEFKAKLKDMLENDEIG